MRQARPFHLSIALALALGVALAGPASPASAERERHSYIVVFKASVENPGKVARDQTDARDARLAFVYRHALKGYAARMTAAQATNLSDNKRVAFVERDGTVTASATQTSAPWGSTGSTSGTAPSPGRSRTRTPAAA